MRDDLLKLLVEDAYRQGDFKLSSGRESKHYVNCKPVTLSGEGITLASLLFLELIKPDVVAVGGLTLGADPLVSGVVMSSFEVDWTQTLSGLIVRKNPKGYGTDAYIEGPILPERSKVVVLEDVITTGGSAIKAATRLRDAGYVVDEVLSIVDRQENDEATEFMESSNLKLQSIFTLQDIVSKYK